MEKTKKISIFLVLALFLLSTNGISDTTVYDSFATNGPIFAITRSADVLYLGGSFTAIGKRVGAFYFCDLYGNEITSPRMPQVDGTVYAITPDGSGGFYIGGSFAYVGGLPRTRLAHILNTGQVDPVWQPGANSTVRAIVKGGDGKIYVGGAFTSVTDSGGTNFTRNRLAAFDINGNVLGLNMDINNTIYDINYYSNIRVLIGGAFTTINGTSRTYFAVIDPSTDPGILQSVDHKVNGVVYTIARTSTQTYIGGAFTQVNGYTRNRIAMYDSFMNVTPLAQDFNVNNTVQDLFFDESNKTLYATGNFTNVNGGTYTRNYAAAFNTSNAQATPFNPDLDFYGYTIMSNGTYIYIGGSFTKVNNATAVKDRLCAAAFDKTTGVVIAEWVPDLNLTVFSLAPVTPGSTNIAVGGSFKAAKTVNRNYLASVNISNGTIYPWNPNVNNYVFALALTGTAVYAGGSFTTANGGLYKRNYIAAFDTSSGNVTSWDPNANGVVYALLPYGNYMYIGGAFTTMKGTARNYGAAVSISNATLYSWDPNVNGEIRCLTESGGIIYAGGLFTKTAGGTYTRNHAAAFSLVSGVTQSWNPDCNDNVLAIQSSPAGIFLGGQFTTVSGVTRNRVACVTTSGSLTSFDPNADSNVKGFYLDNNTLIIFGEFTTIGGLSRPYVAAYDLITSSISDWAPNPNNYVYCATRYNNRVALGGYFTLLSYLPHGYGAFIECPPQLYTPTATVTMTITPTLTITNTVTKTITPTNSPTQTITQTITQTSTRTVTQTITPTVTKTATPVPIYSYPFFDDFSSDLGWDYGIEWQRGPATESSGHNAGYPDPVSDVSSSSDDNVAGTVIGGNMSVASNHPYYYLTSPFIDTLDAPQLQLRFYRYLNCDYPAWISATVEVFNGSSWIPIYVNSTTEQDSSWKEFVYDVTAYKSSQFRVRFGHAVNNYSGAWIMSGWNLDDIYIGIPYTPTATITQTITPTFTLTVTLTPTLTYTITTTITPTLTKTVTATITQTITQTITKTITATITPTATISPTSTNIIYTLTITPTFSVSPTDTITPTISPTSTVTETITQTFTETYTNTQTITQTNTQTITQTITATVTETVTSTITVTLTSTKTERPSTTFTQSSTITETLTPTLTYTLTETLTITQTSTCTQTETITPTITLTVTNSFTETETLTSTITQTITDTFTVTQTLTPSPTETQCVPGIFGNKYFDTMQVSGGSSLYASKFQLLQDAAVRKIYVFVGSGSGKIMAAIYTDSLDSPDTLLYPCIPKDCATGWNEFTIPLVHLNAGYYWLALQAESGIQIGYKAGMPLGSGVSTSNIFGTFPDPFGECSKLTRLWSIYAEFCPDSGYLVTATITPTITQTSTVTLTHTNTPLVLPTSTITPTPKGPEPPKEGQVYAYPVPAKDKLTFICSLEENADVKAYIFDFAGNLVKQYEFKGIISDVNKFDVDVSKLSAGVYYYIIKAKTESGREIKFKTNKFLIKR